MAEPLPVAISVTIALCVGFALTKPRKIRGFYLRQMPQPAQQRALIVDKSMAIVSMALLRGARRRAYETGLEQAADTMVVCLEAGQNLLQALESASRSGRPPLKDDLNLVLAQYKAGVPLSDALEQLDARVQVPEVTYLVEALNVCNTQGGSLKDLLSALGDVLRERREWKREVVASAAEARWSALALASMPPLLALYLFLAQPDMMAPMLNDPAGIIALLYCSISWMVGIVVVSRIVLRQSQGI